jgi:hypothetical protein
MESRTQNLSLQGREKYKVNPPRVYRLNIICAVAVIRLIDFVCYVDFHVSFGWDGGSVDAAVEQRFSHPGD